VAECTGLENRRPSRVRGFESHPLRQGFMPMSPHKLPFTLTKRQWAGVACIYLAAAGWAAELFIPFINIAHNWTVFTAVLVSAESLFLIGIFLLG
jgi:hypothetical protein